MTVNILHFEYQGKPQWGLLRDEKLMLIPGEFKSTGEFIEHNTTETLATFEGEIIDPSSIRLLSPITRNQQFLCQAANYRQHMLESGVDPDVKHYNMIFTKATSCIVPADSVVERPTAVRFLDYEIELGLVLKCRVTDKIQVTDSNLHEFIAGIVIVNDYSARDVQIPEMQFYKGKSFRTFGPIGPRLCLLQRNEMHYLKRLDLLLTVNGEKRQQDNTRNMVFGPAETLSEISGVQDLAPGDLIATGTPSGCALSIPSPAKQRMGALMPEKLKWKIFMNTQAKRSQYLRPGDLVEAKICSTDGVIDLGVQQNRIVQKNGVVQKN